MKHTHYGPELAGIPESWYIATPTGRITHIKNKATGMSWVECTHTARQPDQFEPPLVTTYPPTVVVDREALERVMAAILREPDHVLREMAVCMPLDTDNNPLCKLAKALALPETGC